MANEYDDDFDSTGHWEPIAKFNSNESEKPATPPVEIPMERLSAEALDALIDSFILREGTDYGLNEAVHETKRQQVRKQLEKDHAKIIFDPDSETVTILTAAEWKKLAPT